MPEDLEWMPKGDWRGYESYVLGSLAAQFPGVRLEANVKLAGKRSGVPRQIDVLAYADQVVAIECKYFGRRVDVKCVEAFIGMLGDVEIQRGILVTAVGFSEAAKRRALNDQLNVELQLIHPDRLSEHQHRGAPLVWRAPLGISLGLIDGWTCDTELTEVPGGAVMMMYPLGHSRGSAMRSAPVIYANFLSKPRGDETLEELAKPHQDALASGNPNYRFEIERMTLADGAGVARDCFLRTASGLPPIYGEEHALYIDYGELGLLLVLCAPPNQSGRLKPELLNLYRTSIVLHVVDRRGGPPATV